MNFGVQMMSFFLVSQTPTCVTLSLTVMMDLMSRAVVQVRTFHNILNNMCCGRGLEKTSWCPTQSHFIGWTICIFYTEQVYDAMHAAKKDVIHAVHHIL